MKRNLIGLAGIMLVGVIGCRHEEQRDPWVKPQAPEAMNNLSRMVGTWEGTCEMVKPTADEMEKYMPGAMDHMPKVYKGASTSQWVMDGMAIREEGWHDRSKDSKEHYVAYITWNPRRERYEGYYTSDWGGHGTSTMWMSDDGDTFHMRGQETDVDGNTMKGRGHMHFVDNDTMEWSYSMLGPLGIEVFRLEGTSYRKK